MYELPLLQATGDWTTQAEVFEEIFFVFLALGTLVGVIVVGYTLYNAYTYRDTGATDDRKDFDPPVLGELPTGQQSGKGKKLFLSFGLSAVIVISLVVYSYGLLLYVEEGPTDDEIDAEMEIEVQGHQFYWEYIYPNGHETTDELRVPVDTNIQLQVTSGDVWHNFGAPELRVKEDAIPGEYSYTWFAADETGEYTVECFELCGAGHSEMTGTVVVMEEEEFEEWYEDAEGEDDTDEEDGENDTDEENGDNDEDSEEDEH